MATYSDHDQRALDEASGQDLDRRASSLTTPKLLATLRSFERLIDAAERVVIAYSGMGSAIEALREALPADSAVKKELSP